MSKYVKKLGSDKSYKRPKVTYTEKLSADEIAEKLQGYEKVTNIAEVPINTHLRYFKKEADGSQTFKMGGFLHNKENADTYVMLTNNKTIWSVQVKTAVFFKKMSHKDEIDAIHKQYQKKLDEKDEIISKLRKYIKLRMGDVAIDVDQNQSKSVTTRRPSSNKAISKRNSGSKSSRSSKSKPIGNTKTTSKRNSGSKSSSKSKPKPNSKYKSK